MLVDDLDSCVSMIECGALPAVLEGYQVSADVRVGKIMKNLSLAPNFPAALHDYSLIEDLAAREIRDLEESPSSVRDAAFHALCALCTHGSTRNLELFARAVALGPLQWRAAEAICKLVETAESGSLYLERSSNLAMALLRLSRKSEPTSRMLRHKLPFVLSKLSRSSHVASWCAESIGVRGFIFDCIGPGRSRDVTNHALDILVSMREHTSEDGFKEFLSRQRPSIPSILSQFAHLLSVENSSTSIRAASIACFLRVSHPELELPKMSVCSWPLRKWPDRSCTSHLHHINELLATTVCRLSTQTDLAWLRPLDGWPLALSGFDAYVHWRRDHSPLLGAKEEGALDCYMLAMLRDLSEDLLSTDLVTRQYVQCFVHPLRNLCNLLKEPLESLKTDIAWTASHLLEEMVLAESSSLENELLADTLMSLSGDEGRFIARCMVHLLDPQESILETLRSKWWFQLHPLRFGAKPEGRQKGLATGSAWLARALGCEAVMRSLFQTLEVLPERSGTTILCLLPELGVSLWPHAHALVQTAVSKLPHGDAFHLAVARLLRPEQSNLLGRSAVGPVFEIFAYLWGLLQLMLGVKENETDVEEEPLLEVLDVLSVFLQGDFLQLFCTCDDNPQCLSGLRYAFSTSNWHFPMFCTSSGLHLAAEIWTPPARILLSALATLWETGRHTVFPSLFQDILRASAHTLARSAKPTDFLRSEDLKILLELAVCMIEAPPMTPDTSDLEWKRLGGEILIPLLHRPPPGSNTLWESTHVGALEDQGASRASSIGMVCMLHAEWLWLEWNIRWQSTFIAGRAHA